MNKKLLYFILLFLAIHSGAKAQFESFRDSVVQLFGVVMTADSLRAIPGVSIMVKGQARGTISNVQGVFSIVVLKGDVIEFTHVSFKPKSFMVPHSLESNQQSVIQLMVEDTVYLPATIIKARPTKAQFERAFLTTDVPDDEIEIARKNNSQATLAMLSKNLPADGREAVNNTFRQQARQLYYSGQAPPMNVLNPFAWAEFVKAWKRGDFKKKTY